MFEKYIKSPLIRNVLRLLLLVIASAVLKFALTPFIESETVSTWIKVVVAFVILASGVSYVLMGIAKIIEETTEVLSERTKLAAGFLQSFGTAFPDMILGVVAAVISLRVRDTDYALSIQYAMLAAAATFGSNIYNIAHAAWCVFRQNLSNIKDQKVAMLPGAKFMGMLSPMRSHIRKPNLKEINVAIDVLIALTVLTTGVVVAMVLFGQQDNMVAHVAGDLYQLTRPIGIVLFAICIAVLYLFRKTHRTSESPDAEIVVEENFFRKQKIKTSFLGRIF